MDNRDIDQFFEESNLTDSIRRHDRPPNVMWMFNAGEFPVLIQTQENVNRMRIVAYIGYAANMGKKEMARLLDANYHSALDARYALSEGQVVSAFIHPLRELTLTQFILGLYQTITCAETFGTTYSGGTLVFAGGHGGGGSIHATEDNISDVMELVVEKIKER